MSDQASDKVTLNDEISSTRTSIGQGEESGGGSSSHDRPMAIADQHNVQLEESKNQNLTQLSVVIESPATPQPQPQPQPRHSDAFLNSIANEGGKSGEASGETSNNTQPAHKIQRVPQMVRLKEEAHEYYNPQLVSIGPYHCHNKNLVSFEKIKKQFTRAYVESCEPHSITELYDLVAQVVGEARSCYAEDTTGIDDTAFTQMMFLDGCFILQFMYYIVNDEEDQLEKMMSHDIALVQRDLFLLENQLPLIVLQKLTAKNSRFGGLELIEMFIQELRTSHYKLSLLEKFIAMPSCGSYFSTDYHWEHLEHFFFWMNERVERKRPVHLLEYTWKDYTISSGYREDSGSIRYQHPRRSAMDLKMVGIRFRPSYRDSLSHIEFKSTWTGGILILPKINIDNATISLLHNLVAYEHCLDTSARHLWVTNYICFLDSVIDSANDVKELKYAGIITNFLGNDEEVVKVISRTAARLVPRYRNTRYFGVMSSIEEYHSHKGKTRIASWIAEVMHDHFRSPGTAIAVFAALFALFLTAVQAYFAAFPRTQVPRIFTLQSNGG